MNPSQDLVNLEILAFGQTTVSKFKKLKILLYGLKGVQINLNITNIWIIKTFKDRSRNREKHLIIRSSPLGFKGWSIGSTYRPYFKPFFKGISHRQRITCKGLFSDSEQNKSTSAINSSRRWFNRRLCEKLRFDHFYQILSFKGFDIFE